MRLLITGGAGFIGSALIRHLIRESEHEVLNYDALTYAGNLESLASIADDPRYHFVEGDIANGGLIAQTLSEFEPDVIIHLAAESHVDRSIDGPAQFVQTNVVGTYVLLEAARQYWQGLPRFESPVLEASKVSPPNRSSFRFLHVSTDEVYGDLDGQEALFTERTPYAPTSPYSASKAASDHLVRAWHRTFGLPVLITNCSNNYGPYQFPEKLIPLMILNALEGRPLPVYGDGKQIRDWLYVEDHARALYTVATTGTIGETYNIGGRNEKANIEVVETLCELLQELKPSASLRTGSGKSIAHYRDLIRFVDDRPGHDRRYAIDCGKIERELGWCPIENFDSGLRKTVEWYLCNPTWSRNVQNGSYRRERLGLPTPTRDFRSQS